ncbi:MAG: amidohydrolase family protein [Erysipelotrichales bacterium]
MHKIIDFHSHLGDIFAYEKNVIFKKNVEIDKSKHNPFDAFSKKGFEGPFMDPDNPEEVQNIIDMTAAASWANTLEKLQIALDNTKIEYVCLYPVEPFISFDDYLAVSKLEKRILPFTSVDWRDRDVMRIKKKLMDDFKRGAYGLKIHPILQSISLRDPIVEEVLDTWATTDLPIVTHCGENSYYPDGMKHLEVPEYGNVEDFIYLLKKMPHVKFVAAHCGGLGPGSMEVLAKECAGMENLWVDTTFRSAVEIKTMVELFGEDRVLFGVDRPFGGSEESVATCSKALSFDEEVSKKVMYDNAHKLIKL